MEVKQISTLVNSAITDSLGGAEIALAEDLSNVVDVGASLENLVKTTTNLYEKFTGALVNQIGKVIIVNRVYSGNAPSVLMDGWLYGSIMEKIGSELPTVTKNDSWDLKDGQSYDPHVYHTSKAYAKFFNKMTTFEIDKSILDRQIRQSFQSASQLNSFISMLFNEVDKALTIATDDLIYLTIGNMIAVTVQSKKPQVAVNLLDLYNKANSTTLKAADAYHTPEFIRFAAYYMSLYPKKMSALTKMYNLGGKQKFTPTDMLKVVTLNEFQRAAEVFLQSDVYHDQYTALLKGDVVPYWQAPGDNFDFADASTVKVTPIKDDGTTGEAFEQSGIIAVMFDRDALGVANFDRRVTTAYNPKGEFTNYFYKQDARYFNDFNEQFVVFYIADASEAV